MNAHVAGSTYGTIIATGAAQIDYLQIDGSLGPDAQIIAADFDAQDQPLPDSGNITTLLIGSDDTTDVESADGNIITGELNDLTINGDINGTIQVGTLDSGTIDGDMNGLIEASGQGEIGYLSIGGSLGDDGQIVAADMSADDLPLPDTGISARSLSGPARLTRSNRWTARSSLAISTM